MALRAAAARVYLVVDVSAIPAGVVERVADLYALDRLDAHHGLSEQAVKSPVPVDVAPQPHRQAGGPHHEDASQRVACAPGVVYERLHLLGSFGVGAPHGGA